MRSVVLTSVQFLCLGILLAFNPWVAGHPALIALQAAGVLLGSWAILVMSRSRLNITPVPLKGAVLVTSGPYRLIRHPMYTSLILMFTPVVIAHPQPANIAVLALLLINLVFKLRYEEKLLRARFDGYKALERSTWRLIPWVY